MRRTQIFAAALLFACSSEPEGSTVATLADTLASLGPPPPIALYGDWVRVRTPLQPGDTLRLTADSTAQGIIPWPPGGVAKITRWKLVYASRDPVVEREDWRRGHRDGGDADCLFGRAPDPASCRSLPYLCLGGLTQYHCEKFVYMPDSLLFSTGLRYVRLRMVASATDSDLTVQ